MASAEENVKNSNSLQRSERTLSAECALLWQQLQDVQEDLRGSGRPVSGADSLAQIYRHKEKLLKAQITLLKEHKVKTQSACLDIEIIKDKLAVLLDQLGETLEMAKRNRSDLETDIKNAARLKEEQEQVRSTLEKRLHEEEQRAGNTSETAVESEINNQLTKYNNYYKQTLQAFLPFVHKHFPPPRDLDQSETSRSISKKKGSRSRLVSDVGGNDYLPLSGFLEQVMNQSIDYPSDPYIMLDSAIHYQPYVELLLRSGIIVRHPHNEKLLKITPFHL